MNVSRSAGEQRRGVVASGPAGDDTGGVTATSLFHSILDWLRAGYPGGVPGPDRVPLLALLRSTPLTEDQIKEVIAHLTAEGSAATADGAIDGDEIAAFIQDVTHHDAGPENIQRVAAKLAAAGWPLAGVEVDGTAAE
jgi:hypothetical protein